MSSLNLVRIEGKSGSVFHIDPQFVYAIEPDFEFARVYVGNPQHSDVFNIDRAPDDIIRLLISNDFSYWRKYENYDTH